MDVLKPMGCGMGSIYPARRKQGKIQEYKEQDTREQLRRGVVQTARTEASFLAKQ